jgi:hypothetical protein
MDLSVTHQFVRVVLQNQPGIEYEHVIHRLGSHRRHVLLLPDDCGKFKFV